MTQYDNAEANAQLCKRLQKALFGEEVVIAQDKPPLLGPPPIESCQALVDSAPVRSGRMRYSGTSATPSR